MDNKTSHPNAKQKKTISGIKKNHLKNHALPKNAAKAVWAYTHQNPETDNDHIKV